jgi:Response regulator receiver domain/Transcriptional regulatory protein, C terminal
MRSDGNQVPVIFLTAKDARDDKVTGLSIGGDDYLTKPFDLEELVARVRTVLRRTRPAAPGPVLSFADLTLNQDSYEVRRGGRLIELSPTEFRLLRYFMLNPGRVLTRAQLLTSAAPPPSCPHTSPTCGANWPTKGRTSSTPSAPSELAVTRTSSTTSSNNRLDLGGLFGRSHRVHVGCV